MVSENLKRHKVDSQSTRHRTVTSGVAPVGKQMNHPQANAFVTASPFASNSMETRGENRISNLEPKPQEQGVLKSFAPRSMAGFVGGSIRNALKRPRATQNS
tara:strand:+ start:250 stop:555 length:306 start_codon:yes stop_codon:yes gene_type:complete